MKNIFIVLLLCSCHAEYIKNLETGKIERHHNIMEVYPSYFKGDTILYNPDGCEFQGLKYNGYEVEGFKKGILIEWEMQ